LRSAVVGEAATLRLTNSVGDGLAKTFDVNDHRSRGRPIAKRWRDMGRGT
jgi:hypothetical protein